MRLLKFFTSKTNRYERPNQNWICGRTCDGRPCLVGPDGRGNCQATSECRPVKKGDRWNCTRPASLGGPCDEGPTPTGGCQHPIPKCSPIRSLRSWRAMLVWLGVATALALVVFVLISRNTHPVLTSGDLSLGHSVFTSRCAECHPGATADTPALQWFRSGAASPHAMSDMCLRCHVLGESGLAAHSLPPKDLPAPFPARAPAGAASQAGLGVTFAALSSNSRRAAVPEKLECSICHEEHHGRDHRLTDVAETICQTCHSVQFESFSHGHPPFQNYPFRRRTQIVFNHISHFNDHFKAPASAATGRWSCASCHIPDAQGGKMLVSSFEKSCAACHGNQVRGIGRADSPSIAFLRLPGMDVLTFEDKEMNVGDWPEFAEGKLTPFMQLLLSDNSTNIALLERVGDKDLLDLSKEKEPVVQDAAALAWAVKGLFYDLATQGQGELERRIRAQFSGQMTDDQIRSLAALLSPDTIQRAANRWFPNLAAEVTTHRAGKPLAKAEKKEAPPEAKPGNPEELVANGGWYVSDKDFTVYFRPAGHADHFVREWLDASRNAPAGATVFAALSDPKAPGYCGKCHSVDENPNLAINWSGPQLDPTVHDFTRFSHVSHFSLLSQDGCLKCHQLDEKSGDKYTATFVSGQRDPHKFAPNFEPMQITLCASCHTKQFVGDSCLTCHNYHVGRFLATVLRPPQPPSPGSAAKK